MMERALKERIIGAAVLVLFVVLVVPIFLDGPPNESDIVTERVLLPGQETQKTQTVVLERNRTEPVPGASAPTETPEPARPAAESEESRPEETPADQDSEAASPAVQKPPETVAASEPEKPPEAAAPQPRPAVQKPASTTGMWAVQLGSFSSKENADKLAADLRKQGYAAFLSQLATPNGQLHRVRIGPQKDRKSAEAMAGRLAKVGHEGQVVPHP